MCCGNIYTQMCTLEVYNRRFRVAVTQNCSFSSRYAFSVIESNREEIDGNAILLYFPRKKEFKLEFIIVIYYRSKLFRMTLINDDANKSLISKRVVKWQFKYVIVNVY